MPTATRCMKPFQGPHVGCGRIDPSIPNCKGTHQAFIKATVVLISGLQIASVIVLARGVEGFGEVSDNFPANSFSDPLDPCISFGPQRGNPPHV